MSQFWNSVWGFCAISRTYRRPNRIWNSIRKSSINLQTHFGGNLVTHDIIPFHFLQKGRSIDGEYYDNSLDIIIKATNFSLIHVILRIQSPVSFSCFQTWGYNLAERDLALTVESLLLQIILLST